MSNNVNGAEDMLSEHPGQPVEVPSARDELDQTSEQDCGQHYGFDNDIDVAATYIGAKMIPAEVLFQDFSGVAPPLPSLLIPVQVQHPPGVHLVDIERFSPAYFASYDPGAPSRRDRENNDGDNAAWR